LSLDLEKVKLFQFFKTTSPGDHSLSQVQYSSAH
jgi:hypothetical protein